MTFFTQIQTFFNDVLSISIEHEHELSSLLFSRDSILASPELFHDCVQYATTHIQKQHRALRIACSIAQPDITHTIRVIRQICVHFGYVWEPVRYFSHTDPVTKKKIMMRAFRCYPSQATIPK